MKKTLALVCSLIIFSMCLMTGCGGGDKYADSEYVGTWNATTATYAGIEINVSDIMEGGFVLTLEASGKATLDADGSSDSGKWEPKEDGNGILLDGSDELNITGGDGKMTMDYSGVTLNLEKQ